MYNWHDYSVVTFWLYPSIAREEQQLLAPKLPFCILNVVNGAQRFNDLNALNMVLRMSG
jgi:hypothetical protein